MQEECLQGNPVDRHSLEQLRPESFSSILILADDTEHWEVSLTQSTRANIADADSRCLASLLLLRDIQSSRMHYGNMRQSGKCFPHLNTIASCLGGKAGAHAALYAVQRPLSLLSKGSLSSGAPSQTGHCARARFLVKAGAASHSSSTTAWKEVFRQAGLLQY